MLFLFDWIYYFVVFIDHTTGLYNGYYLLFKQATSDTPVDSAQFQSRNFAAAPTNACVFIFYYYMFGVFKVIFIELFLFCLTNLNKRLIWEPWICTRHDILMEVMN